MCRPSGEEATDFTQSLVCPSRGLPTAAPVPVCQIRMVQSSDPEMMRWPLGEGATDVNPSVCPSRILLTAAPVSASQIRMVRSTDPDMMCSPSGEYAMDHTHKVC